jgi:hypothetical protein
MRVIRATLTPAACGTVLVLTGCSAQPPSPTSSGSAGTAVDAGTAVELPTHGGIRYLHVGSDWFERVGGPPDDGNANPPSGWGNPVQRGHVTITGDLALFRDDAGHHKSFKKLDHPPSTATPCA